MSCLVAKVGGSLFDLPNLGDRICRWLKRQDEKRIVLLSGGGQLVDQIRRFDKLHDLGQETSHWLSLQAVTLSASILARLSNGEVVQSLERAERVWNVNKVAVLDAEAFCRADEAEINHLPHTWDVTSDSVAARVAVKWQANRLVLLKSADPPRDVERWVDAGYVDPYFSRALAGLPIAVSAINFRALRL